jgi:hypothetical protein
VSRARGAYRGDCGWIMCPDLAGGMGGWAQPPGGAKKAPRERQNCVHMHLFVVERSWWALVQIHPPQPPPRPVCGSHYALGITWGGLVTGERDHRKGQLRVLVLGSPSALRTKH